MSLNNKFVEEKENREKEFIEVLHEVQSYLTTNFSTLFTDEENADNKEQMMNHIKKYLFDHKLRAKGMSSEDTIQNLINEMTEFSILNPFLDPSRNDIEEININAWNDIKINYSNGRIESSKEHFFSPEHCENIIRRLLSRESKMVLDKSRPIVRGHLSSKIRITVMGDGVIDSNVGIAASLRIVNPKQLKKENFISNGTATNQMITLLEVLLQNGTSMCITGETNSGKTTLMSYLLTTIPYEKRIFTIEEDVREFNLVVTDKNGKVLNNVVHTRTKKSDDPVKVIDQEKLLETALTMNPDVICVAEMKGKESFAAQEAANTGHTVITTTHANSCRATYSRMADLCKGNTNMDNQSLIDKAKNAFPIVVFIKKYKDNIRRVKEITECVQDENGETKIVTLFRYRVLKEKKDENGNVIALEGKFEKIHEISENLKNLLIEEAVSEDLLELIVNKEEVI
ncbi:type II secretion system protein E [Anaeromicropila herbilytica]|uniref:Type II secretion system protein E n=1 Tax=Anaeromicropila herbilytica TaxID=2785025 RepID=A0A7R7EIR2_9FIRM|nr:type II secretion system protein E [Anaeromicropila herbilytica]